MTQVSDINRETELRRVVRDNAPAALMVVLALVSLANGLIMGVTIAVTLQNSETNAALQRQVEIDQVWKSRLIGVLERHNINVPEEGDSE